MDYFRGCAADVGDYKRLEKLAHVLQRARRMRVTSAAAKLRQGLVLVGVPWRLLRLHQG